MMSHCLDLMPKMMKITMMIKVMPSNYHEDDDDDDDEDDDGYDDEDDDDEIQVMWGQGQLPPGSVPMWGPGMPGEATYLIFIQRC